MKINETKGGFHPFFLNPEKYPLGMVQNVVFPKILEIFWTISYHSQGPKTSRLIAGVHLDIEII